MTMHKHGGSSLYRRSRHARDDDGYATVAAIGIILAIAAVALALVGVASHVVARHQAQLAADMAAVAAAEGLSQGDLPCPVAQRIAGLNHASVVSCRIDNRDVLLEVTAGVSVTNAHAKARAGPV
ncbi:flp pilus-assembly TadE/G-like family protein [Corynebacterium pseudodiphtheriticum]|uniref:Rv3654c family TadE-like protein n=1 Tax=Corynebacterium pseudodiphtheriticum TaxID=37637 RepID=UPI0020BE3794|nr:Rv3654c family TadE-like protein [Corynebacterium pseudodiphtheriticum]UQV57998.1 flp pilus-assembly TadE/G-like family protein [Corynebacterium pseudodiphtheriticum]